MKVVNLFSLLGTTDKIIASMPLTFWDARQISTDSREIKPDQAFLAIKGENFNGIDFYKEVINKGIKLLIINSSDLSRVEAVPFVTMIAVEDTIKFYGKLANAVRKNFEGKVIALTGSVGKSSTKTLLELFLSNHYKINATFRNFNNQIGLPKTILNLKGDEELMILELGTNSKGEIEYLTKICEPDFTVLTNIGKSHIGNFENFEGLAEEKLSILKFSNSQHFLNLDDPVACANIKSFRQECITYSAIPGKIADIGVKAAVLNEEGKEILKINILEKEFDLNYTFRGPGFRNTLMAAISVASQFKVKPEDLAIAVNKFENLPMRMEKKKLKNGQLVLLDCYNASLDSMINALETLKALAKGTKTMAVLGDMLELGRFSEELHREVGRNIARLKIDYVFTYGEASEVIVRYLKASEFFGNSSDLEHFKEESLLEKKLEKRFKEADFILFKGSRRMAMERFYFKLAEGMEV